MNDDQNTLNGYFNMMRAFLETQERVMSMVLRGNASERARVPVERVLPVSAAYEAQPIALPAQVPIAPAPVAAARDHAPVNGHAKEIAVKPSNGAPTNGTHSPPTNGTHAPPIPSNGAAAAPANGTSKSSTLDRAASKGDLSERKGTSMERFQSVWSDKARHLALCLIRIVRFEKLPAVDWKRNRLRSNQRSHRRARNPGDVARKVSRESRRQGV